MKTCSKCNQEKSLDEFALDKRRSDGRGSWCRPCCRAYLTALKQRPDQRARSAAHYQANKTRLNEVSRQRWAANKDRYGIAAEQWRAENRDSLLADYKRRGETHRASMDELKGAPCVDCGERFPPFCMEFDHVRGVKRFALGKMANHRREAVLEELAKCELVCCACHRVRTQVRKGDSKIPRVQAFRSWLNALKNNPCLDCGKILHHAAMDFDHVNGAKTAGIAQMWSWGRDRVLAELAKCELVCANCHRIRTQARREDPLMPHEERVQP